MTQCTAMAMKPSYIQFATFAMQNGYERGQCSRKAKVGSLCTQHEKIRLGKLMVEERIASRAARLAKAAELKRLKRSQS
jgi:hypothetical protein